MKSVEPEKIILDYGSASMESIEKTMPCFFSFGTRGTIGGCQVDIYFDDDSLLCPAGRSVGQAAYWDGRPEDGE